MMNISQSRLSSDVERGNEPGVIETNSPQTIHWGKRVNCSIFCVVKTHRLRGSQIRYGSGARNLLRTVFVPHGIPLDSATNRVHEFHRSVLGVVWMPLPFSHMLGTVSAHPLMNLGKVAHRIS
jgi:hypothetical protein